MPVRRDAAFDRDPELAHPQIEQLFVRPVGPLLGRQAPVRLDRLCAEASAPSQTQVRSIPGDEPRSKPRARGYVLQALWYTRAHRTSQEAYESCVSCCARRRCCGHDRRRARPAPTRPAGGSRPPTSKPAPKTEPKPDQKPEPEARRAAEVRGNGRRVASRTEEKLINAPATMTRHRDRRRSRARRRQNFAELLRTVPGVNVTQVSARDINVTTRGATGTLSTGQLALLDGRSLYQDFFGFVMWDFLPVNLNEIKQVEVIRGPASAVWGANALNGVVNVITKSPREMQGTSAVLGVGGFDRDAGTQRAARAPARCSTSAARTRRRSTTGSRSRSRRAATRRTPTRGRPARFRATAPTSARRTTALSGLHEPGHDAAEVRRARGLRPAGRPEAGRSRAASRAPTASCTPASVRSTSTSGSVMGYGKVNFTNKGVHAGFFTNVLNGDATNLLTIDATTGKPIDVRLRHQDVRLRGVERPDVRAASTS